MKTIVKKFLIAGTVRNGQVHLEKSIEKLNSAFQPIGPVKWLVIESDSSDETLQTLEDLKRKYDDFNFMSLGNLENAHPKRTDRIATARNSYLTAFQENPEFSECTHLVVADLDGVNDSITTSGINSCWEFGTMNVYTANQTGPYYDIWALRHPLWSPNDCWKELNFYKSKYFWPEYALQRSVLSRMITIKPSDELVEVESAFGGLAIYPRVALKNLTYQGLDDSGDEICEHVMFSEKIRLNGHKIFVNPAMTNTDYTDFSVEKKFSRKILRFIRQFKKMFSRYLEK